MDILSIIFGLKTQAIFDIWSLEHLFSGLSVGSAVKKKSHKEFKKVLNVDDHSHHSWWFDLTGVMFFAYLWEAIEHYLETGLAGFRVEYWFQGVEFWPNRLIADPIILMLGYLIAKKYPSLVWPARILSVLWLFFHVFVFPHSMYLQKILFGL
ncbi:MAG: hypothetical protein EXS48_03495 [Candidatus Staskawiczbacteria bacterium]|nr:hypothetical protein [Candidatus Staskawiczbacteria bacterium]